MASATPDPNRNQTEPSLATSDHGWRFQEYLVAQHNAGAPAVARDGAPPRTIELTEEPVPPATALVASIDPQGGPHVEPAPSGVPGDPVVEEEAARKLRKKKEKARSAWISFAGRIIAQVVGAVTAIVLGVHIVNKSTESQNEPQPVAGPAPVAQRPARPVTAEPSVAVLPLQNFSDDPKQEYFVDGMTEAVIADLSQVKGLRIISRTSSMRYKGQKRPLPEIAQELGADFIVEGSVAKDGNRIRITAQLIDARRDEHVWARSYDRTLSHILTLQGEVSSAIAKEVGGVLDPIRSDAQFPDVIRRSHAPRGAQ
jgi:TolB-like protein